VGLAPLDIGHLEVTNRVFFKGPLSKIGATHWLVAGLAPLDLGHLEVTNRVLLKSPLLKSWYYTLAGCGTFPTGSRAPGSD
jgi:hypothetical protein